MSLKELDNKLKKIKKDLSQLEKDLKREKSKQLKDKSAKKSPVATMVRNVWEKLRVEVSGAWDGKMNPVEEIRAQRNRE